MIAHWAVLAAAALTILVAATVAAALAVFTGQALPQAVKHDLAVAPDTALSIAAAAVAAAGCAIALPRLLAPAIDLSAFTHSQAPAPLPPGFAAFLLPLAALLVITAIALAYEVRSGRGRGVAVTMRT